MVRQDSMNDVFGRENILRFCPASIELLLQYYYTYILRFVKKQGTPGVLILVIHIFGVAKKSNCAKISTVLILELRFLQLKKSSLFGSPNKHYFFTKKVWKPSFQIFNTSVNVQRPHKKTNPSGWFSIILYLTIFDVVLQ